MSVPLFKQLVIVTKKFGPSFTGATYATFELLRRWKEAGLPVQVFYMMRDADAVAMDVPSSGFRTKGELTRLVSPEKEGSLFYSDDHLSGWMADLGLNYVHTYHGNWPDARRLDWYNLLKSFYFIPLYKRGVTGAMEVVNVSRYFQERFSLPLNPRCRIIHNGIALREGSGAKGSEPGDGIIMVGNVDRRKYRRALGILKALPNVRVHIYGKLSEPAMVRKLNALPNVTLMGFQKEIPYGEYRLFLSASSMENLSIALCEAVLAGIPVLGYKVGGLGEVIRDGQNGKLFSLSDQRALVQEIRRVLKGGEQPMDQSFIDDFNWDKAAASYELLFKEKGLVL